MTHFEKIREYGGDTFYIYYKDVQRLWEDHRETLLGTTPPTYDTLPKPNLPLEVNTVANAAAGTQEGSVNESIVPPAVVDATESPTQSPPNTA